MNTVKIALLSIPCLLGLFSGSLFSAQQKLQGSLTATGTQPKLTISHLDYAPRIVLSEQCKLLGDEANSAVKVCAAALCIQDLIPVTYTDAQLKDKLKNFVFRCNFLAHLDSHIDTLHSSLGFSDINKKIALDSGTLDIGVQVTCATARVDHWLTVLDSIRKDIHEFTITDKIMLRELAQQQTNQQKNVGPFKLDEEELLHQTLSKLSAQEREEAILKAIHTKTKNINRKMRGAIVINATSTWLANKINAASNKQ